MKMHTRRLMRGFTLIEVMTVVIIVAILAAIAYPSYTDTVRRSRRADAIDALLNEAQRAERHFTVHNSYASLVPSAGTSPAGHYAITLTSDATSYTLTATAASASQMADTACTTMTLNQLGVRGPSPACWGR